MISLWFKYQIVLEKRTRQFLLRRKLRFFGCWVYRGCTYEGEKWWSGRYTHHARRFVTCLEVRNSIDPFSVEHTL
jgi:hypothetical protein